jgi:hypothetical protein
MHVVYLLNKQKESELFTLIIRNVKMKNSITRDIQKYLKPKPRPIPKIPKSGQRGCYKGRDITV